LARLDKNHNPSKFRTSISLSRLVRAGAGRAGRSTVAVASAFRPWKKNRMKNKSLWLQKPLLGGVPGSGLLGGYTYLVHGLFHFPYSEKVIDPPIFSIRWVWPCMAPRSHNTCANRYSNDRTRLLSIPIHC